MCGGAPTAPPPTLDAARSGLACDLEALPHDALDLHEPVAPAVRISPYLHDLTARVSHNLTTAHARGA
jgi:hypothetical protein